MHISLSFNHLSEYVFLIGTPGKISETIGCVEKPELLKVGCIYEKEDYYGRGNFRLFVRSGRSSFAIYNTFVLSSKYLL